MENKLNESKSSRRTFLRTATLGTAGLAIATSTKSYSRILETLAYFIINLV
jgi:hypothetical protein